MSRTLQRAPKPEIAEKRAIIKLLQPFLTPDNMAALLGTDRRRIEDGNISLAATHLAYVMGRMMTSSHVPLTMLEIICLGKYGTGVDRIMPETPQGILQQIKDSS